MSSKSTASAISYRDNQNQWEKEHFLSPSCSFNKAWNQVVQDCKHVLLSSEETLLKKATLITSLCSKHLPNPAHHSSADDPAPDKPNLLLHCVPLNWSIHRPRLTYQSPAVRIGPYKYRISERNQFFVDRLTRARVTSVVEPRSIIRAVICLNRWIDAQ